MTKAKLPPKKKAKRAVEVARTPDVRNEEINNADDTQPAPRPHDLTLPDDIINQILRRSDTPTLAACMRASHQLYAVAGPLLYRKVTVNRRTTLQDIIAGSKKAERPETTKGSRRLNLKADLVSNIKHLTVQPHECRVRLTSSAPVSDLETLLVMPEVRRSPSRPMCDYIGPCPILRNSRARKVVLQNIHSTEAALASWPLGQNTCIKIDTHLTLVFTTYSPRSGFLPYEANYSTINMNRLESLRIIIAPLLGNQLIRRPGSLWAPRYRGIDVEEYCEKVIAPAIAWVPEPVEIYVFCQPDPQVCVMREVTKFLDDDFARREIVASGAKSSRRTPGTCRPDYTIKGLDEYMKEGCEDEFTPGHLRVWRIRHKSLESRGLSLLV